MDRKVWEHLCELFDLAVLELFDLATEPHTNPFRSLGFLAMFRQKADNGHTDRMH